MTLAALAGVIALLAIYITSLGQVLPPLSDRYSPRIVRAAFIHIAIWPLVVLVLSTIVTGALVILPDMPSQDPAHPDRVFTQILDVASLIVLFIATLAASIGTFSMWSRIADGTSIIEWLRDERAEAFRTAIQDVLSSAIDRGDEPVTLKALGIAFNLGDEVERKLLEWFISNHRVLSIHWLVVDLLMFLNRDLDENAVKRRESLLRTMFVFNLDNEEFDTAKTIMSDSLKEIEHARPLTRSHAELVFRIGEEIWKISDQPEKSRRSIWERSRVSNLEEEYIGWLIRIWKSVSIPHDEQRENIEMYCNTINWLLTNVYNKDSFEKIIRMVLGQQIIYPTPGPSPLTANAAQALAFGLHLASLTPGRDDQQKELIYEMIVDIAAALVSLGKPDIVPDVLSQGGIWNRFIGLIIDKDTLLRIVKPKSPIGMNSYNTVANFIGLSDFDKTTPVEILPTLNINLDKPGHD